MTTPERLADPERDGTLFVCDLDRALDMPSQPGVFLRAGTLADTLTLQAAMESVGLYPEDAVETRLREGRHPYVAETDGRIVAYGWIALSGDPVGDLGLSIRLRSDDAYIYDCATAPAYRGRGLYPALLRLMAADLQRAGRRYVWIGTAPRNFTSQRGIARAGFEKVADVSLDRRPDGSFQATLYGVPGIARDLLDRAAWFFYGRAFPETGIPQGVLASSSR